MMWSTAQIPTGWAACNGQTLLIRDNIALFSLLGTQYGGDGRINFALPDLRGRAPINHGQQGSGSPYPLGEHKGQPNVHLNINQIPHHTHRGKSRVHGKFTFQASPNPGNTSSPYYPAAASADKVYAAKADATQKMAPEFVNFQHQFQLKYTGSSEAHNNMQPYLAVNFIICTNGAFPSRP